MESRRCDLVLLSWNHPECTRPCVESILAHTTVPSRLIIVDQASEEETKSFLKSLRPTPAVEIEILWNPKNVGYSKGMNLGLARASAPYVCFLNNDILVSPGWLEEMIALAESDASIGAVNPASNTFGILPPGGSDRLAFAESRREKTGRWLEVHYGEGFCLLAKREILLKVGGFDGERYEQIYFEDADLGRKLQALGLRCVMAEGTYVWHAGGQSTSKLPERRRLFQENERRFVEKWGKGQRVLFVVSGGRGELIRASERARGYANRSGEVWILTDSDSAAENLPRHLKIRVARFPRWRIPWAVLWKVLMKKKKFDRIVTDSAWLRWILKPLRFLHHAEVNPL